MLGERTSEIYPTLSGMHDWIRRVHGFVDDLAFVFASSKLDMIWGIFHSILRIAFFLAFFRPAL